MSFISIAFVAFLPIVFLLYWFVFRTQKWQNVLLVASSLLFYGWADWQFVGLLLLTGITTYASGLVMSRNNGRRAVAIVNIILNLGILAMFKYYNFFVDNFAVLLQALGMKPDFVTLNIVLPVGVSFYTFQAIGYTVDVYRRTVQAERNPFTFLAFLSFFPQLVAGPIERATNLLPQMQRSRTFDRSEAVDGMRQMLWGFVKKVVVADSCGVMVDQVWHNIAGTGSVQLLVAALMFAFQIYCDFSGYSDIAIGCARLFGIRLSRNFAFPFFAVTMREFWRRWHISLMSWFRDYVFIPLGGNRCRSQLRNHANLMLVFLLSGLWHGANWTFVLWGGYNAVLVMASPHRRVSMPAVWRVIAMASMTMLFALGLIVFRAPDLSTFGTFVARVFAFAGGPVYGWHPLAYCAAMVAVEWAMRHRQHGLQLVGHGLMRYRLCRWGMYYTLTMTVIAFHLMAQQQTAFIYFRF